MTEPNPSNLPKELPLRESDADLDVAALDAVRARIAKHVDETQGAWSKQPTWKRAWPLVLAVATSLAWVTFLGVAGGAGGLPGAAALAVIAAVVGFVAIVRAPGHPGSSEKVARFALAGGCLALA